MVSRPSHTIESQSSHITTKNPTPPDPPQHLQTRLLNTIAAAPRGPVRTLAQLIMSVPGLTSSRSSSSSSPETNVYAFVLDKPEALINLARWQLALAGSPEEMGLEGQSETDVEELRARVQNHIRWIGRHGNSKYAVVMLYPRI